MRASGLLINSMGWVEGLGYELLCHAARALKVDALLVLGADRLHSQLAADFKGAGTRRLVVSFRCSLRLRCPPA